MSIGTFGGFENSKKLKVIKKYFLTPNLRNGSSILKLFTAAEEKNTENVLIIKGEPAVTKQYLENFEKRKSLSRPSAKF